MLYNTKPELRLVSLLDRHNALVVPPFLCMQLHAFGLTHTTCAMHGQFRLQDIAFIIPV